jgi:uncharacterized protein
MNEPVDHNIPTPQYFTPFERPTMSPFVVLGLCLGMFVIGNIISSGFMFAWAAAYGMDFQEVLKGLSENTPVGTRNFMRGVLFLNHLFSFIIPALATAWLVYKSKWLSYFELKSLPRLNVILIAFAWLIVCTPFVQYAYYLNKMLPLPAWMIEAENATAGMLEAIISKESFYEIILNVCLIAVIPGIGEELMFRGIVQKQIGRLLTNEHVQVWVSAAIFSGIHMQFQGFFARMILGAVLGYLYIWTRNLWVPMIVHFLNNGLQVIGLYAFNIKASEMDKFGDVSKIHWAASAFWGMASLIGAVYLGNYIRKTYYLNPQNTEGVVGMMNDE